MPDKTLTCSDCGQPFTFSQGEQEFFQQRGMTEPKRCKECRAAKKAQRGGSGGGGRDDRGNRGGGSYDRW
jgi:hypothetical protein